MKTQQRKRKHSEIQSKEKKSKSKNKFERENEIEENKEVLQSNLTGFLKLPTEELNKPKGVAEHDDFQSNKVSIWSWNVNGINAMLEKGALKKFIDEHNPDVLCINETKIDIEKLQKNGIFKRISDGYEQYWNCCKVKKGYSGTALFTRVKPINVIYDIGMRKHDGEGRVITAEFKEFVLITVYVPNAGEGLRRLKYRTEEWDKDFFQHIETTRQKSCKPVIVAGDLNVAHQEIDIYDTKGKEKVPGFTPQERQSFDKFLNTGYIDTFRYLYPDTVKYTFWSVRAKLRPVNKGWRLDYFLINNDDINMIEDHLIHDKVYGSDHCPIELKLSLNQQDKKSQVAKRSKSKKSLTPKKFDFKSPNDIKYKKQRRSKTPK